MEEVKPLLEKLRKNLMDPSSSSPENICLVGLSGAGKSSLLNSLNAALTCEFRPWHPAGRGSGQTKTTTLVKFPNCGVRDEDLKDGHPLKDMIKKLPNLWDFIGFADDDSEQLKEILRLVISGCIPPGTDYRELEKIQKQKPNNSLALKKKYYTPMKDWKMTSIVFVHSYGVQVPIKLINCLKSVLKETDPDTAGLKYTVNVFVVLTKQGQKDTIDIKDQLSAQFDLTGATEFSMEELTNYNDATGYEFDSEISKKHLELLCKMTYPKLPRVAPNVQPARYCIVMWLYTIKINVAVSEML